MSKSQPMLFDVPRDSKRSRKAQVEAFKSANGIWTHSVTQKNATPEFPAWTALLMPKNPRGIKVPYEESMERYNLKHPVEIIAHYCRVLDEAGFLVEGKTEREAIRTLCQNVGIPCDL